MQIASPPPPRLCRYYNKLSLCEREKERERGMLAITHPDALLGLDWGCQTVYRSTCKWSGDLTGRENILYDSWN